MQNVALWLVLMCVFVVFVVLNGMHQPGPL
jgi:hypothetical protein